MTAALREEAWRRYQKGETPRRIAWQLEIHFDEVLEMVSRPPLPTCRRPGCEREVRHVGARYCCRECGRLALVARNVERSGCGCTDKVLCPRHGAKLRAMWANERSGT